MSKKKPIALNPPVLKQTYNHIYNQTQVFMINPQVQQLPTTQTHHNMQEVRLSGGDSSEIGQVKTGLKKRRIVRPKIDAMRSDE